MARRRYLSTKISLDTKVNKLAVTAGDFAALLYTWMIPHVEDDARLTGDPDEILMMVCPGRRDKTTDDIIAALQAMNTLGLIEWNKGAEYIQFPQTFYGYQTYITDKRKTAQGQDTPIDIPRISAKQRKTAQNSALVSSSSLVSLKSSSCANETDKPSIAASVASATPPPESPPLLEETHSHEKDDTKPKKTKTVNPFWDALLVGIGHEPPPSKKGAWGKAIHDLKEMGATPEEIIKRCEIYRLKWPTRTLTATDLAGTWYDVAQLAPIARASPLAQSSTPSKKFKVFSESA